MSVSRVLNKTASLPKRLRSAAEHTDFEPEIYDVWKQQSKSNGSGHFVYPVPAIRRVGGGQRKPPPLPHGELDHGSRLRLARRRHRLRTPVLDQIGGSVQPEACRQGCVALRLAVAAAIRPVRDTAPLRVDVGGIVIPKWGRHKKLSIRVPIFATDDRFPMVLPPFAGFPLIPETTVSADKRFWPRDPKEQFGSRRQLSANSSATSDGRHGLASRRPSRPVARWLHVEIERSPTANHLQPRIAFDGCRGVYFRLSEAV